MGFPRNWKKSIFPIPKSSTFHSALKNKFEKNPALISIYVADPVWRFWHHFLGSTLQNKQNRIWSMLVWKPLEFRQVASHHRPLPNHLGTRIYLKKTLGGFTLQCQACPKQRSPKDSGVVGSAGENKRFLFFSLEPTFSLRLWNQIHFE